MKALTIVTDAGCPARIRTMGERLEISNGANAAEGRRLLLLFICAFVAGALVLFVADRYLRPEALPDEALRAASSSVPSITVVPWEPDIAWYERTARDGTPGDEPESGVRLLVRLRERALMNFVLDPRFSAGGGFRAVTPDELAASPKIHRASPIAVAGVLTSMDRRRFESLFGQVPNVPSEDVWLGHVVSEQGDCRFLLWDDNDLSELKGKSVRVLGVFHRLGAPPQTTRVLPMVYAKRVVESPPAVQPTWPPPSEVARLASSDAAAKIDSADLRAALAASLKSGPTGDPKRILPLDALASLPLWIGQPARVRGRVVWTSEEPFVDHRGEPYEHPDPINRDKFGFRATMVLATDGGYIMFCEPASRSARSVGNELVESGVPLRAFEFRNRGAERVGGVTGGGYDPARHGVTRTLLIVGYVLTPP